MEFKLSDIGFLSSATKAFVEGDEKLKELLGKDHPFYDPEIAIKGKEDFSAAKRAVLVKELKAQYAQLDLYDTNGKVAGNIESLNNAKTYTVTTGQQLHLFMGPAFVIYKIIHTIKTAEHYAALYPGLRFVPVFWLASEDHDFEEIKDTKVFQKSFPWEAHSKGPTGRYEVSGVPAIIEAMRQALSLSDENRQLLDMMDGVYQTSRTLSEATIKLAHKLFADYGLVCIDADNANLKRLFAPIMERDILEQGNIDVFEVFNLKMEQGGFSLQLKGRDINVFYIGDSDRSRIVKSGGNFEILGTGKVLSTDDIRSELAAHPENFSPNAVLRPLYQECILPNVCYIGGNAEVNYWLQLKDVFEANNIPEPCLVLRQSAWAIPEKARQWLDKQAIEMMPLFHANSQKDLLNLISAEQVSIEEKIAEFNSLRQSIQDTLAAEKVENLKEIVEAGKVYEKLLKRFEQELLKKQVLKQENTLKKLQYIKDNYFNINQIQERSTSAIELLLQCGKLIEIAYQTLSYHPSTGKIINIQWIDN